MKHASNPRRGRGRNSGKRNQNSRNRNFESNGSDQKVRGTAQQVLDKYLALARDATSSGDRIAAEGYFQHAEHYYRILHSDEGALDGKQSNDRNRQPQERRNSEAPQEKQKMSSSENSQAAETVNEESPPVKEPSSRKPRSAKDETPGKPEEAEASAEEKPRRRGRPRKTEVAEEAPKGDEPSETAA